MQKYNFKILHNVVGKLGRDAIMTSAIPHKKAFHGKHLFKATDRNRCYLSRSVSFVQ